MKAAIPIKFMFFDDRDMEFVNGFCRSMNKPVKCSKNPLIVPTLPCEFKRNHMYGTAMFDKSDNLFKIWYLTSCAYKDMDDVIAITHMCYAFSEDGIHWTKPMLDIVEGSNIVIDNVEGPHGASIIYDDNETDPMRKYKMVMSPLNEKIHHSIHIFTSPDGIHWTHFNDGKCVIDIESDCHIGFFRDKTSGNYVISLRTKMMDRRVWVCESADLLSWTAPVLVIDNDRLDVCGTQFYGMQLQPYGNYVIGMISMFYTDSYTVHSGYGKMEGSMDIQLAYSRDHYCFHRCFQNEKFIARGEKSEWDSGVIIPSSSIIMLPEKMYFYYSGTPNGHGDSLTKSYEDLLPESIGMAQMRPDGFVSLNAQDGKCEFMTKIFMAFSGDIYVNAEIEGYVKISVCNKEGNAINGFSYDDCILESINSYLYKVVRPKNEDYSAISEREIRLRVCAENSKIYSVTFSNGADVSEYWNFREIGCINPAYDIKE